MADERPPIEQLLDRLIFAPIGVLVALRDELPKLAAQGRREVDLARMFGQFAVKKARRELDKRLAGVRPAAAPAPRPTPSVGPPTAVPRTTVPVTRATPSSSRPPKAVAPRKRPVAAARTRPAPSEQAPAVVGTALPIAEYDSLAASQVVARLGALDSAELAVIQRYETAGRSRRTVLGKIAQLQAHS